MRRDKEFLIELATKYYEGGFSQQELAKFYNLSRPTVSNLLKQCREEGIVEIRIASSASSLTVALSDRLKSEFSLNHIVVIPSTVPAADLPEEVGRRAGELVSSLLHDHIHVGLSWGGSLYQAVKHLSQTSYVNIQVIQMVGGLRATNSESDGYALARSFSEKSNGSSRIIHAPILVGTDELKEMLISEASIRSVLDSMSTLDLGLVGVSSNDPAKSSLVREGFITHKESQAIWDAGGVGHLCGYHYDLEGKFLDIPQNRRIIGITEEELRRIPEVIAVAWGADKVLPMLGALRGGLVKSLVTDEDSALRILSESNVS